MFRVRNQACKSVPLSSGLSRLPSLSETPRWSVNDSWCFSSLRELRCNFQRDPKTVQVYLVELTRRAKFLEGLPPVGTAITLPPVGRPSAYLLRTD